MAAKSLSGLNIVLSATTAPFASAMKGAKASVSSFASSIGSVGATLAKFTGIAGIAGAALGGIGFGALVNQQLSVIDSTSKLADRLGVSTGALVGLQHAAGLAGSSAEGLQSGMEFMNKALGQAAAKGGPAADALQSIGLSIADVSAMNPEQQFVAIGDAIGKITDPAKRAYATTQLFGRSGQQLGNLFLGGAAGMRAAITEADDLGLSFSRVDGAKVEAANDALTRMQAVVVGLGRRLAIAFAPLLLSAANVATAAGKRIVAFANYLQATVLPIIVNFATGVWSVISSAFAAVYNYVAPIVSSIGSVIAATWKASVTSTVGYVTSIYNVVSAVFGAAWSVVKAIGSGIASAWTWAMDLIGVKTDATGVTVAGTFSTIGEWGRWLQGAITTAFNTIAYILNNIGATFELVGNEVALFFVRAGNEFTHGVSNFVTLVKWFGTNFTSIVRDAFVASWTITKNGVTNIANVISNLPGLIAGTTDLSEVWTPLLDGFEATTSELPKLAARTAGPLEAALQQQADSARDAWGTGLADYLDQQAQQAAGITDSIASTIEGMTAPKVEIPTPDVPKIPAIAAPEIDSPEIDTSDATKGLDAVKDSAKGAADAVGLLESGSAKAMQLAAQAAFAAAPKVEIPKPPKIEQQPIVSPVLAGGGGIAGAALGAVSAAVEAAKPSMPVVTTPSVPELPRAATKGVTRAINLSAPSMPKMPSIPAVAGPSIGKPSMPNIPAVEIKADTSALDAARQQADRLLSTLQQINGLTVVPVVAQLAPSQQPQQIDQPPQPTPLPRRTVEAVREGGSGGRNGNSGGKDVLVAVVRDILREIRGADKIEFAEVR